ncbi:MAG: hypothetical protein JO264_00270 [Acidisphaera sp.]|nr:hypothetical protein [Acidisphaera sp.]
MSAAAASTSSPVRLAAHPSYTLRDLLSAVFFHRRALIIAFAVPVVLGLLAALLSHTVYVAQARLLVLLGSEYVFQPQVGEAGSGMALDRNQIVQGELEILGSSSLRIETLKTLGLQHVYPDADPGGRNAIQLAADRMEHDITLSSIPQTNVIEIDYRNRDPNVAAEVLRTMLAVYIQQRGTVFERTPGGAVASQRDAFAARLHEAEAALVSFGAQHGITDYDEQMTLLVRQKSDNAAERLANEARIEELTAQVASLSRQLRGVPPTVAIYDDTDRSQQAQGLTGDLTRLEVQRAALLARYRDDFPLIRDVDRQIATLRAQIGQAPARESALLRRGPNPTYETANTQLIAAEADLRGQQARRVELANASAALQARLDELNGFGRQYRDLRRARDVLDDTYRNFERNSEVTGLADALQRTRAANIRVVQPPEPPARGRSPALLLFAGGILLGLVAVAATLTLLTVLRQVFVSVEDVERALGLPVLLAVPLRAARTARPAVERRTTLLRRAWGT